MLPLEGLRVVDLTQVLSGPFCTMLLADLGADVVKVEPPAGDATRGWGPWLPDDDLRSYGGYFQSVNRNKRGAVLDLKSEAGREALQALLAGADVLVENYRPGVMDRLGLGWETLHARYPRLVYACVRGFGDPRTGASPYVDWPAFDIVAQGMGGLVGTTGSDPEHPVKTGPALGDVWPAALLTVGLLAAVRKAEHTGEGSFVDVGMYDSVVALCERAVYLQTYAGVDAVPQGNTHPLLCPYGVFATADGWVTVAAPTDNHWRELTALIGRPELGSDPRYARNEGRHARSAEVIGLVTAWTSARTTAEVTAALAGRVPCGPVNRASDIVADPHIAARRMLVEVDHPGSARRPGIAGSAVKVAGAAERPFARAPMLGEHTDEVLREAGLPEDRIAALRAEGALGCSGAD